MEATRDAHVALARKVRTARDVDMAGEPIDADDDSPIELIREAVIDVQQGPDGRRITVTPDNTVIATYDRVNNIVTTNDGA